MKQLHTLLILLIPFVGFGQGLVDCNLLTVTDVLIHNDSITFEINNADTMDTHYPYVAYTLNDNGDTIQKGQINWYVTFPGTSYYYYTNLAPNFVLTSDLLINMNYPLSIYFRYSNLTGNNPGDYTCELLYNPLTDIIITNLNLNKVLLKTINLQGKEVKHQTNQPIIEIYDDGTVEKKLIIE